MKIIFRIAVIVLVILLIMLVYRLLFEFKRKDVEAYIQKEASKYKEDPIMAARILRDGVLHILESYGSTKQVRDVASATGVPKEQVLVNEAEKAAVYYGYLNPVDTTGAGSGVGTETDNSLDNQAVNYLY